MARRGFDLLRLGVGLAHSVPDAEIRISAPAGPDLSVSACRGSDIDICDLRRLLLSSITDEQPDVSQWIEITDIRGSLSHCGGGIYESRRETDGQRWFATLLPPLEVIGILQRLENRAQVDPSVHALLKPDPALGMTAVRLRADNPDIDVNITETAETVHTACIVSELLGGVDAPAARPPRTTQTSEATHTQPLEANP